MAIYMEYDGIKSDATETAHKDWIQCGSVGFSAFREAKTSMGQGGSRQGTNVSIGEITVTKKMCTASPDLFLASVVGLGKKVKLHITRTGANKQTNYLEVELAHCCVTNYNISSDGVSHLETLTLNFLEIDLKYIPVKDDGTPGTPMPTKFSIPTGKAGK